LPKEDEWEVISDDDSDGEDDVDFDENYDNDIIRKLPLEPVMEMPKVEQSFKKIECSFEKCSVSKIQAVKNKTAWLCPIHVERVKIVVEAKEPSPPSPPKKEQVASVLIERASASTSSVVIEEKKKPVVEKPKEVKEQPRKLKRVLLIHQIV
jgi:hypothetical protein